MLFIVPTPSPVPTVTVTQTVVIPTSFPAPIVRLVPPADDFSWTKDFLLGNFGSALIGFLGALLAAWLAIRATRGSQAEDERRTLALDYANAARNLSKQILPAKGEAFEEALEKFELLSGRIVRRYAKRPGILKPLQWVMARVHRHVGHSDFGIWVMLHGSPIGIRFEPLRWAIKDVEQLAGEMNKNINPAREDVDELADKAQSVREQLSELATDLRIIEHTTLEWMNSPRTWKPDRSAREAHERVKKLLPVRNTETTVSQARVASGTSDLGHLGRD